MHWVVFPWRSTDVLTAKLAGSWEEKSPTGCCGSTADPVDRRFFCGSNNSSTSRKHANNWGNSSWWQAEDIFSIWLLLAGHSIQTKWSSSLWSHGEETVQLDRADREDGEAKPEENSEGRSAFQEGRPKAHPDVHAISWESSALQQFLSSAAFLAANPNKLCQSRLDGGRGLGVLCLRTWGYRAYLALCLRAYSIMVTAVSLRL